MKLAFDQSIAEQYKNYTQKARVLTEAWVGREIFCPNCGCFNINKYKNNLPVADFYCPDCNEDYELKSKKNGVGAKIVDGAYRTMLERLLSNNNPNIFLLTYDFSSYEVTNFLVIPKHFFIPEIIQKRKPLSPSARRAGWIGCNILLQTIPQTGKIYFIKDKQIQPTEKVLSEWQKTLFLRSKTSEDSKGWLLDIMLCIDRLGRKDFSLDDIYRFEKELSQKYPINRHIKDKIRQQLQILRDKGYLKFTSRGNYSLI